MSLKRKRNRKKNNNARKNHVLDIKKNDQGIINKLRSFFDKHPSLVRILDQTSDVYNKFMIGYFVFAVVLVAIPVVVSYYCLPENIRNEISALLGTILSVIIVPVMLNAYNRKKDDDYNRFEINKELYFELTALLLPVLLNRNCTQKDTTKIKDYIRSHYNVICVSFSSGLFTDVCQLCKCCDCSSYKNIEYYAKKIIKHIRKECGNSKQFNVSPLVAKLDKEKQ